MAKRNYIKIKEKKSYKKREKRQKKILYIHGFMSGANSYTVRRLICTYGHIYEILSPEVSGDPHDSISVINRVIAEENPRLIIGSSLGGFYALMCESGDIPVIVVNPCVNPYSHLQRYLDHKLSFHSKRDDGETSYCLTTQILERFKDYDVVEAVKSKIDNVFALLSSNDEVLGDSHCQFFMKMAEEMQISRPFFRISDFGHRLIPWGYSCLKDIIDNTIEDLNDKQERI